MQKSSGLLTDLYQLTMLDAYLEADMRDEAVFEFFVRRLPKNRSFLMVAGLEQLLNYLERLSFRANEIEWLESTGRFSSKLLNYLKDFQFLGEVRAMPEGTLCFENEPIVQVIAALPEAQLIETRLINLIHYQTLIASKAARCVLAAPGKMLVDFGLRRAHGAEAGLLAARASYIAGFTGTSTVLAEAEFGIPIFGTMAHSFIQAHSSEIEAFEHFARTYPDGSVLLIDTYDTLAAARAVTRLVRRLRPEGITVRAVRLDSGDMPALADEVRKILDGNGCEDISIFCSGSLDEYVLATEYTDTPVDGFGIGTHVDVSADAPYLDCAYKIQEYAGTARRKISPGKATWPGRKQVYRRYDADGLIQGDALVEINETCEGTALLETVMRNGERLTSSPDLTSVRDHAARELASLPEAMQDPFAESIYPVKIAKSLKASAAKIDRSVQTAD
ncbi:MAG: nicotinate phosphoribosyltransferase [Gammaproteobacteria bacterium]|nr:nicotinate phosphoribosyltransferase [Gammaproteobacteria bacterium]